MTWQDFYEGLRGKKSSLFLRGTIRCHLLEAHGLI